MVAEENQAKMDMDNSKSFLFTNIHWIESSEYFQWIHKKLQIRQYSYPTSFNH